MPISTPANAPRTWSRVDAWQCTSPAAAMRTVAVSAISAELYPRARRGYPRRMSPIETLKRAAATLRDAGVPFALAGSAACWARGAPEPRNDIDFAIAARDAERAERALAAAGMRTERPPEGWLLKAWDDEVLVDLI